MMSPNTTAVMLLGCTAMALCLLCAANGSPIDNNSGADPPLFSSEAESDDRGQHENSPVVFQHMLAVRSPKYNFGLGKRKYIITDVPGAKRLPHYNFGLGKRASVFDYEEESVPSWNNEYSLISKDMPDYETMSAEKRASGYRYDFGMGKRRTYDFGLGKRSYQSQSDQKRLPNRYNFGLGRR
ncbi:helicostatins [Toxorhynchites rutilus septentrionalis]|uniref:helicostatins n=1 Tax=Toxorhynchites rutilus septentrionalis TaxID=329112 RepID=UPI0024783797|nr:helicostatins [Toxorhynchites rutilus septentrionalis]